MTAPVPQFGPDVDVGFVDKRRASGPTTATPLGTPGNYASTAALDTRLDALGYTAAERSIMTQNDKIYAVRSADDSAGI